MLSGALGRVGMPQAGRSTRQGARSRTTGQDEQGGVKQKQVFQGTVRCLEVRSLGPHEMETLEEQSTISPRMKGRAVISGLVSGTSLHICAGQPCEEARAAAGGIVDTERGL